MAQNWWKRGCSNPWWYLNGTNDYVFLLGSVQYWSLQCLSNAILAVKKAFFGGGHFPKMCYAKFPPFTVKASPNIACHKTQWLQFVNRDIVGLQSWHSRHSRIFQMSTTLAILTRHWLQLQLGKHTYKWTPFFKWNWVKSDRGSGGASVKILETTCDKK